MARGRCGGLGKIVAGIDSNFIDWPAPQGGWTRQSINPRLNFAPWFGPVLGYQYWVRAAGAAVTGR